MLNQKQTDRMLHELNEDGGVLIACKESERILIELVFTAAKITSYPTDKANIIKKLEFLDIDSEVIACIDYDSIDRYSVDYETDIILIYV